jgi:glutathione synthase
MIAIQGDCLQKLNLNTDTSLLLAANFIQLGYKIFWYEPYQIYSDNNSIYARGVFINVLYENNISQYNIIEHTTVNLKDVKVILIRQDPPYNMQYVTNALLLSLLPQTIILNSPEALLTNNEKLLPLYMSQYGINIPNTIITNNIEDILQFESEDLVLKPLYGHGGNDVIQTSKNHTYEVQKYLNQHYPLPIICQAFIPNIMINGDKRILICDGEIIGFFNRKSNSFLTNIVAGGIASLCELNDIENIQIKQIIKILKDKNIFLAGIDMIDGKLIEVNITSPTGLVTYNKLRNVNLGKVVVEKILKLIVNKN